MSEGGDVAANAASAAVEAVAVASAGVGPSGTGASGAGGATAQEPDGAWTVNFAQGPNENCGLPPGSDSLGTVTATVKEGVVTNGRRVPSDSNLLASVSCTVSRSGDSRFNVTAAVADPNKSLSFEVDDLEPGATRLSPASGGATFQSALVTGGKTYNGFCGFYFKEAPETVAPGRIWGAFNCTVHNLSVPTELCEITESPFLLENCSQ